MKIYVGADHQGFHLKEEVLAYLSKHGYDVEDVGGTSLDPMMISLHLLRRLR